jgi:hypothetical protein
MASPSWLRLFAATLLGAAAGGAVIAALLLPRRRLRHIVALRFRDVTDGATIAELEAGFRALRQAIPQVRDLTWGHNSSKEGRSRGLTHVFELEMDSPADVEAYLVHPAHAAFVERLLPHLEDVCVVDYTLHRE